MNEHLLNIIIFTT